MKHSEALRSMVRDGLSKPKGIVETKQAKEERVEHAQVGGGRMKAATIFEAGASSLPFALCSCRRSPWTACRAWSSCRPSRTPHRLRHPLSSPRPAPHVRRRWKRLCMCPCPWCTAARKWTIDTTLAWILPMSCASRASPAEEGGPTPSHRAWLPWTLNPSAVRNLRSKKQHWGS